MRRLSALTGISPTSCVRILKEDLHLHYYRYTRVRDLKPADFQQRINYCHWFLGELDSATPMDPNFFICTDEAWFSLSGSVNSQNSPYYATHNLHLRNEQPLHSAKLGIWCAISGHRIITHFSVRQLTLTVTSAICLIRLWMNWRKKNCCTGISNRTVQRLTRPPKPCHVCMMCSVWIGQWVEVVKSAGHLAHRISHPVTFICKVNWRVRCTPIILKHCRHWRRTFQTPLLQ